MDRHDSPVLSAQISLFKSQFETLPYQTPTLGQLLTDIRGGLHAELVQELRQIRQTRGAGALDKKMPALGGAGQTGASDEPATETRRTHHKSLP